MAVLSNRRSGTLLCRTLHTPAPSGAERRRTPTGEVPSSCPIGGRTRGTVAPNSTAKERVSRLGQAEGTGSRGGWPRRVSLSVGAWRALSALRCVHGCAAYLLSSLQPRACSSGQARPWLDLGECSSLRKKEC